MTWFSNPGRLPEECIAKDENDMPTGRVHRVIVRLRNGMIEGAEPVSSQTQKGWDATAARWSLSDHAYDIVEFKLA